MDPLIQGDLQFLHPLLSQLVVPAVVHLLTEAKHFGHREGPVEWNVLRNEANS